MPKSVLLNDGLTGHYMDILRCPICHNSMQLINRKSLICGDKHCFDLAKQGYVNLLSHGIKTKYNKQLFEARKLLAQSGFFEPLNEQLCELIQRDLNLSEAKSQNCSLKILDAGCGEGSHLANIQQKLGKNTGMRPLGVGMDLAKEGIQLAARDWESIFWCVGDLAQCPFEDRQFDVILNILSPANYSEFERILTDDGLVIKVVPGKEYLTELREIFYEETEKQDYSNAKTVELFENHLTLYKTVPLRYSMTLNQPLIANLVHMTPLTWGADEDRIGRALKLESLEITIDLTIMVGRKKCSGQEQMEVV
ncbi:methyltransferase family protein [Desulfitobacterium dehalogenans ATCC 51507]|uniref:Methyltransferase family protein n=1 Tax=Desulfitobacterium dehalogenans (strain ATCC 51507 / DSM 9161 / JW/IU-DC1) TaxID=756499 RepID=I4A480_DESDJ|nr:methyltransferase domain-containing protein [Desulfitobacterium dehalogenans]AFL98764.1 methyltransferase family protein [Desulfitobacterium dehalogenans ATCC 51507]